MTLRISAQLGAAHRIIKSIATTTCMMWVFIARYPVPPKAAPHLPPPGRQIERKQDIQIRRSCRPENAGGG